MCKSPDEVFDGGISRVEQMELETKRLSRLKCPPFQRRGPEHERPRPVRQSTGTGCGCRRLEDARVIFHAGHFTQNVPERTAQNVSR